MRLPRPRRRLLLEVSLLLGVVCLMGAQSGNQAARREFLDRLAAAAAFRDGLAVRYTGAYVKISYPGGDVPAGTGVCTDEIIRSYRAVGVDLQKEVHEDMARNFAAYPQKWGLRHPDTNIDHRRVPNLMTFFARQGERLPIMRNDADYLPGEIVVWELPGGIPHIGVVTGGKVNGTSRYKVLHNIGYGPREEDVLFAWKITGHYRYYGPGR